MEFSNQIRSKNIKRSFNILGVIIVLVGLGFLWFKLDTLVLITAGVFALYIGIAQFFNLCYVHFSTENGKVTIQYYQVISFLKKKYETIEFPHQALVNFRIERSLGFADLDIAIKTKRGIAEYPSISLAALNRVEVEQIRSALEEIIRNNRRGA